MSEKILKLFIEKGFLLDRDTLDFFKQIQDEDVANEIINKIEVSGQKLVTKNLITKYFETLKPVFKELDLEKQKIVERFFVNVSVSVEVKKETRIESRVIEEPQKNFVKILSSPTIPYKKIEVKDFVKHFRSRYNFFKIILQNNPNLENLTSIDKINGNRAHSIIAMVKSKATTKNKNIILEVEDLTGSIKVLINQNKEEIYEKAKEILLDDILGLKCSGTKEFLFVNDLFYPDAFLERKKKSEEEKYVVFISDIHVGSKNFLENNFKRFIDWINGKNCDEEQRKIIEKIKYIFVVGDSIDGVGIYPGQEKELKIKDIREQYVKLAEFYKQIPERITIIQCPGQHDAVRVAEPQPPIGEDFGKALTEIKNLYLVSNPSLVEIESDKKESFKVLMYHGASMARIINEIEELRLSDAFNTPARVVKHLLLRRHLSPMHGAGIYIPDAEEDPLIIKQIPDIILTGDLHKPDIDMYHNILIVSSSCWQSITPFEEKVGNHPDPCKVPIFNLKTREIKILDFSDVEVKAEKECREVVNGIREGEGFEENKNNKLIEDKKEIVCEVKKE